MIPVGHNIIFDIKFIKQSGLLSNDEYNVMYSKYIDERSIIEISDHFNIKQNTVKAHIFNSKKKLRKIYNI